MLVKYKRFQAVLALIVLCVVPRSGLLAADVTRRQVDFDIKAQALTSALIEFSKQTQLQVMSQGVDLAQRQTPGVSGRRTIGEALTQLLANTDLAYATTAPNTIAIMPHGAAPVSRVVSGSAATRLAEEPAADGAGVQSAASKTGRADDAGRLEEVVVTAQKRRERLQDVPISITALSGRELDKSSGGVIDALARVPGVSMSGGGSFAGSNVFSIRGVVAVAPAFAGSSTTAYYIDSVPYGFVRNAQVPDVNSFDLQQVEVLRGPQGTLYGASALNGVVRILTHDADLDALEFKSRTTLSDTEGGGGNYRGDAAINVPIVQGKLAVRAVLGYEYASGWINSPVQNEINDNRSRNARIKLNARPTDDLSVGLNAWFSRLDSGAPSVSNQQDFFGGHNDQSGSTDFNTFGFKLGYDFPGISLSSMTSYIDYKNLSKIDFSHLGFGIDDAIKTTMAARALSEEFLARSATANSPWRWTAGTFYRDSDEQFKQVLLGSVNPDVNDLSKSFAFFGELTRTFNDGKFELTGGLRYFKDEVKMHESPNTDDPLVATDPVRVKDTFDALTPRFVLTWHPSSLSMLYASYSEGFRSGYQNFPYAYRAARALGGDLPAINPDTLKNYEVGAKGNSASGRISYDASVYYMDWQDISVGGVINLDVGGAKIPFGATTNGKSASGMGVDLATSFHPWRGLSLGASFSWNGLEHDATTLGLDNTTVTIQKGARLSGSAEYTAGASIEYFFPLRGDRLEGGFSALANYSSKRPADDVGGVTSDSIVDAKVAFSLNGADRWTASLFVDNVANEHKLFLKDAFLTRDEFQRPRTVGVQFEYRFQGE